MSSGNPHTAASLSDVTISHRCFMFHLPDEKAAEVGIERFQQAPAAFGYAW